MDGTRDGQECPSYIPQSKMSIAFYRRKSANWTRKEIPSYGFRDLRIVFTA